MYDMSQQFNTFYRTEVVLPAVEQNSLREKRRLNIKRLKDGLLEYNKENGTEYKICEDRIQGSMAMSTVVQNDQNDYDIDVAIVFEKSNLGGLGPLAVRNVVANALKKKTKQFSVEPEVKTSCVRIKYAEGYHVDFAVYRRYKNNPTDKEYMYEHAGAEWSQRDIKALEEWFSDEIKDKGKDLRKIIRLSKMFCKSRESWKNMPSGLLQTVLCDEQFTKEYSRLDEKFYYIMKAISERLDTDVTVVAPVDNGRKLVYRQIDEQRMGNWKNRLSLKLKELDILFTKSCTYEQAVHAWNNFFDHPYWGDLVDNIVCETFSVKKSVVFNDTEQFIDELYDINDQYDVVIDCRVAGNGFAVMAIGEFIEKYFQNFRGFIPHNFSVSCKIKHTNAPLYDKVLWKVRNVGDEAEKLNDIRGQIQDRGNKITENTKFYGPHYIECYLIKNNVCIAIGHVKVPISR